MQLSLDWISDFVDLSSVDAQDLAKLLTERVAEVEHVCVTGCDIPKVVVGEILKIEPIEGADKIRLTTVDVGTEKLQIICGAQNIHEGAKVPVALVGCVLPGEFKIEKRKMRGVESNGMICSEAELGLAEKSEGIMLLDSALAVGKPFAEVCGSNTIFEIDNHAITHRADLFSQLGFAREVSVLKNLKLKISHSGPMAYNLEFPQPEKKIDVEVAEPKLCARYSALKISNIVVKESLLKIRERLESCGVRAINNVVDATNYVLLELGQPMHAFDAQKITGGWIIVRKAKDGEKLKTLDGELLELSSQNLVIADAEKPVALAGVMGGENSEVSESTTEIILESANFDAVSIRRTSTEFNLRSESSLRFEKRLDPELPPKALARFLEILRETCPELKVESAADVKNFQAEKRVLSFSLEQLEKKLGAKVEQEKALKILRALEFKVAEKGEIFEVEVPSFRAGRDIEQPIDLLEEVIRHLGYADLPAQFPRIQMESPRRDFARELKNEIEDALVGFGFHETATLALVSEKLLKNAKQKIETALRLQNPPSEDYRFLRGSLLTSLLEAAEHNVKTKNAFRLFEVSSIYQKDFTEKNLAVALIVGEKNSFLKIRGVAEKLFTDLRFTAEFGELIDSPQIAHPGRAVEIKIAGKKIGMLAELHPAVAKNFELPESAFFCLDFDALAQISRSVAKVRDLPKFPGVPRDLAILVERKTSVREVENAIVSADEKIQDLKLFDVYEGDKIPAGSKSLAFSLEIRDAERTLEEAEAEEILQKIVVNLTQIGGKLRS